MRRFCPFVLPFILALPFVSALAQQKPPSAPPQAVADQGQQSPAQPTLEEAPVTVKPDETGTKKSPDGGPFGVPALPQGKTSMIGGTVSRIDGIHNKIAVKIFGGGGHWEMAFDERTHFYRDGKETTFENVKKGDRVYVDTMLDGHQILARNIRVVTHTMPADARGQLMDFNNGIMSVRDGLSAQPVYFRVDDSTVVKRNGTTASLGDVRPGSLIVVQFSPETANRGVASTVTLLASPGESIKFAGKVTHLDLRTGIFAIANRTDSLTYDIAFDGQNVPPAKLMVGSDVTVGAVFDGRQYKASTIDVESTE